MRRGAGASRGGAGGNQDPCGLPRTGPLEHLGALALRWASGVGQWMAPGMNRPSGAENSFAYSRWPWHEAGSRGLRKKQCTIKEGRGLSHWGASSEPSQIQLPV